MKPAADRAEAVARAAELPELPARGVIRQFPLDGDSGRALFGIVEGELVARKRQPHAGPRRRFEREPDKVFKPRPSLRSSK